MLDVGINLRKDRRRARLAELIDELSAAGMTETAIAREINTPRSHLNAMKSGTKSLGDRLAARIEARFGKPEGWLDRPYDEAHPAKGTDVRTALLILANALTAAGEIGRLKVTSLIGELATVDHSKRLRYANAIADELEGRLPVNPVSWESVCRESLALLDESKGKAAVTAYLSLVDANYELVMQQKSQIKATQS